jgi:hypothetical protein
MDFIYLHERKQRNLSQLLKVGWEGVEDERWWR